MANLYKPISDTMSELTRMMERQSDKKAAHQIRMKQLGLQAAQLDNQMMDSALQREGTLMKLAEQRAKHAPTDYNIKQVLPNIDMFDDETAQKMHTDTAKLLSDGKGMWNDHGQLVDIESGDPITTPKFEHSGNLQKAHGYVLSQIDPDRIINHRITQAQRKLTKAQQPLEGAAKNDPAARLTRNTAIAKAKNELRQYVQAKTDPGMRMGLHLTHSQILDAYANGLQGQVPEAAIAGLRTSANNSLKRAGLLQDVWEQEQKGNELKQSMVLVPLYDNKGRLVRKMRVNKNAAEEGLIQAPEGYFLDAEKAKNDTVITKVALLKDDLGNILETRYVSYSDMKGTSATPQNTTDDLGPNWVWAKEHELKEQVKRNAVGRDLAMNEDQSLEMLRGRYGSEDTEGQFIVTEGNQNKLAVAESLFRKKRHAGVKPGQSYISTYNEVEVISNNIASKIERFNEDAKKRGKTRKEIMAARDKLNQRLIRSIQKLTEIRDKDGNLIQHGVTVLP